MSNIEWCPPFRNPLFHLVDQGSYTNSNVVAITGPKRSGKSLLLARLLTFDMLVLKRKVWSTMSVKTPSCMVKAFGMHKAMPINWDTLYMLDKDYGEGTIGLDESVYFDDSRTSLSMRNKLLNTVMNQVGHRNLNVYYTVKAQGWLDRRLQFETDLEIKCTDLGKTPWGRRRRIKPGTLIRLDFFDKSGGITGRLSGNIPFKKLLWTNANDFWDAYDTKEIIGIEEMFTGVKVDMKQRVISNKSKMDESNLDAIYNLAVEFQSRGGNEVPCDTFWDIAEKQYGLAGDPRQLGKYLKPLGITRKQTRQGSVYLLKNLVARA